MQTGSRRQPRAFSPIHQGNGTLGAGDKKDCVREILTSCYGASHGTPHFNDALYILYPCECEGMCYSPTA